MQETSGKRTVGMVRRTPDASAITELMQKLLEGDDAEQRETFEFLRTALDEGRPPGYKLFPRT